MKSLFNFTYQNFLPTIATQVECKILISKLYELAPENSSVSAIIEHLAEDEFRAQVAVVSNAGQFIGMARGVSATRAAKQAISRVSDSLWKWRTVGFEEKMTG